MYSKEVLLEKVTLKNTTYKAAIAKLEAQLAHKEEMGEVLHLVDFDQLKIENQQHMETIDAKNKELIRLKLTTGKTLQASHVDARHGIMRMPIWCACSHSRAHGHMLAPANRQALNEVKSQLAKLEQEGSVLREEIAARSREREGFDKDFSETKAQTSAVERTYRRLQAEHNST